MSRTILLLIVMLSCVAAVRAEGVVNDNWLNNQGFEQIDTKTGHPAGWHVNQQPKSAAVSCDTQTFRSGKQSLNIHFDTSKARSNQFGHGFVIYTSVPSRFVTGRTYTVSGYVKARGMGSKGWSQLYIYQYPAPFPKGAKLRSERLRGEYDWTRLVITFTARENISNLLIGAMAYGHDGVTNGDVWFDDFKVEEGPVATDYVSTVDLEFYPYSGRPPDHFSVKLDYRAMTDIITPHAEPARGTALRPLRAMFIAHPNFMRWPAEIAQRSDITFESAAVNGRKTGYKQPIVHECAMVMRERLKSDPQVIVMYPDTIELLISRDREDILNRVRRGGGLVLFDLVNTHRTLINDLIPDAKRIMGEGGKPRRYDYSLQGYTLGKGRIVTAGRVPMMVKKPTTFAREYLADQMVRATYIAGGFEPVDIAVEPSARLIEAGKPWSVTCAAAGTPVARWRVRLRPVRRLTNFTASSESIEVIHEQEMAGDAEVVVPMPPVALGSYMVEATALGVDGRAIGWAMRAMPCDGPVRIDSIDTSDGEIGKDGQLRSNVVILCGKSAPRSLGLIIEAHDTNGRLLASDVSQVLSLTPGRNEAPIALSIPATSTPQVRLRVTLRQEDAQVAQATARFSGESLLREPDYRFAFYNEHAAGLASIGADTIVSRDPAATDLGLRLYPWIDVIPYGYTNKTLRVEDVITSPQTQQRQTQAVREYLRGLKPFRSTAAIAIDEWEFGELREQDEATNLAFFHDYLRGVYGSIGNLNEAWATKLRSFDEVTFELCDREQIQYAGAPLVRWADMQAMKEAAVTSYFAMLVKAGKAVDPDFRFGLSGTRDTTGVNGLDWWQLMKYQGSVASYSGLQLRLQESFAQPGTRLYRWSYVTRDNIPRGLFDPWWWLFKGHDGYLHYGGRHSDLFQPCYAPHIAAKTVRDMVAHIRRGPARLLRGAVREDNGIGLLYSPANYRLQRLARHVGSAGVNVKDVSLSFDRALADDGFDSRWYSYEQLADGAVTTDNVKAFFLPVCGAMSDAEVKALRRFVRQGGVVIADTRPAVYDERLRRRETGTLDDVFGLKPIGDGEVMDKAMAVLADGTELATQASEWDLKLTSSAQARARLKGKDKSAPAVIVHSYGRGKAILLNFTVGDYWRQRAGGVGGEISKESGSVTAGPFRLLLSQLLTAHAGLKPPARIADRDGNPLPQSRIYTYRDGGVRYIGYIQHYGDKEDPLLTTDATLHLSEHGRLYDVLNHQDLGERSVHDLKIKEAEARLFALVPYEISDLTATVSKLVALGGFVHIDAQVRNASERHVFHVAIADPNGIVHPWNQFTIDGPNGRAKGRVHIALNALATEWTVTVTEAISGQSVKANFTVAER